MLLSGVAAFWIQGLGHWKALPLALGLMSLPLPEMLVYFLYSPDGSVELKELIAHVTFLGSPAKMLTDLGSPTGILVDLGWILLGLLLGRVRDRELSLLAEDNRALARRLYEEAWSEGNLKLVDELVSPGFFDYRRGCRGPGEYKRTVAELRRTFPDLQISIEEQSAEGDTITSRCVLAGTDRGGVLWYPPTNKRATFAGVYVDRFSDGRFVEHRGESDTAGLLKQLGLPPTGR